MIRRSYADGEVIFRAGDPTDQFYVTMGGAAAFSPPRVFVGEQDPVFGVIDALLHRPHTYTVTASGDTTVLAVPFSPENIVALAARHPKLYGIICRHLGTYAERRVQELHASLGTEPQLWGMLLATLGASPDTAAAGLTETLGDLNTQVQQQFPLPEPAIEVPVDASTPGSALELLPGMMLPRLDLVWQVEMGSAELRLDAFTLCTMEEGLLLVPLTALAQPSAMPLPHVTLQVAMPARLRAQTATDFMAVRGQDPVSISAVVTFATALVRGIEQADHEFQRRRSALRQWLGTRLTQFAPVLAVPGVGECLAALDVQAVTGGIAATVATGAATAAEGFPVLDALPLAPADRSEIELYLTQLRCGAESGDLATAKNRLTNRYWDCAVLAAVRRLRGTWPDDLRHFLRFGVMDARLLDAEHHARLSELSLQAADGVYYMDEWLENIIAGNVAPTAGDELTMKKLGASDKIDKARQKLQGEQDILAARIHDWKQCAAELPMLTEKLLRGSETTRKLIDLYMQEKDHLKSPDAVLLKWEENSDQVKETQQRLRERTGKMGINEGRILEGIRTYAKGVEELNAARALAKGEDRETPEKVVTGEVNNILRQMAKMSVGPRGNHLSVLLREAITVEGLTARADVLQLVQQAAELDPALFARTFKGIERTVVPYLLVLPCQGTRGLCWEPYERNNRATGRGRLVIPLLPRRPLPELVFEALADFRWQMAREAAAHYWMEEGLTGRYYQYFTENKQKGDLKESFIRNYILWLQYEATGIQKLDRLVRQLFWLHLPFPARVKEQLKNRGAVYALLVQQDKNREKSSGY